MKGKLMTIGEYNRMVKEYEKVRVYCKCGHSVIIPAWVDRKLCNWCGRYVKQDKKTKFKYELRKKMRLMK